MIGWNRRSVQPLIMVHKHECFKYYYDYLVNKGQGHVSFSSCVGRKHQIPFELTGSTGETQIAAAATVNGFTQLRTGTISYACEAIQPMTHSLMASRATALQSKDAAGFIILNAICPNS